MKSRNKFSSTLGRSVKKVNNHPGRSAAKIQLRQAALDWIGAGDSRVFDAFCGDGEMWREVWQNASAYTGCDEKWYRDERTMFVSDNRRVMRCIDLQPYNVFDFDSYGSPWDQAMILADRRKVQPGEKVAVLLTEGSGLKIKMGHYPYSLAHIAGISTTAVGGARNRDELFSKAVNGLAKRMGCEQQKVLRAASKAGSVMIYAACLFVGKD